jgi:hypothetical protein
MTDPLQHVIPPTAPEFMNIFKWDNTELQKWVTNATKMQDRHVADNSTTKYYEYKQSEFDAIQLRICMILFGMKVNLFSPLLYHSSASTSSPACI